MPAAHGRGATIALFNFTPIFSAPIGSEMRHRQEPKYPSIPIHGSPMVADTEAPRDVQARRLRRLTDEKTYVGAPTRTDRPETATFGSPKEWTRRSSCWSSNRGADV